MLYYDVTRDFDDVMRKVVTNELKGSGSATGSPRAATSNGDGFVTKPKTTTNLKSVDDVVAFVRGIEGLAEVAGAFAAHEIDGEALTSMLRAWNSGTLRFSEIKEWFGVSTVGKLFKLKAALDQAIQ
jgi:hypothetical protein